MKRERVDTERLQKLLANAGLGSRRQLESLIADGRVKVNGRVAKLGDRASADDRIKVDGRPVGGKRLLAHPRFVLMYNKPEGEVVTRNDPEGRKTVFSRLPKLAAGRWIAVGRLDINTEGLMLLTNDGGLARVLELPETGWLRRYRVRVHGAVTQQQLDTLKDGIAVDGD